MARDFRRPRTPERSLRTHHPTARVIDPVPACRECGRAAEVIAIEYPEQEGMLIAGDQPARVPLCIRCLEADDPLFWHDILPIDPEESPSEDPADTPGAI